VQRKKRTRRSSKVIPKGMQSTTKLQKAVPKGAQRKFSAQKSFLRECIPKYKAKRKKVNAKNTAEIEGEEVQKTFLRGCRTYIEK
jgi:ribosomal protein L20A (L18A)